MQFENYLKEINKAHQRGDATEHTHRPVLKTLVEVSGKRKPRISLITLIKENISREAQSRGNK